MGPVDPAFEVGRSGVSIRVDTDMLTISDNMRSVTDDIARVKEVIKNHVPVPNSLGILGLWFG